MASAEWRGRALTTLWTIRETWGCDNRGEGTVLGEGKNGSRLTCTPDHRAAAREFAQLSADRGLRACRVADGGGMLKAWFPANDPRNPCPFQPAAQPAHDSAFGVTVDKAQGSEFDEVWLLPIRYNRALSRELVYTEMTRARIVLHVVRVRTSSRQRWRGMRGGGRGRSEVELAIELPCPPYRKPPSQNHGL